MPSQIFRLLQLCKFKLSLDAATAAVRHFKCIIYTRIKYFSSICRQSQQLEVAVEEKHVNRNPTNNPTGIDWAETSSHWPNTLFEQEDAGLKAERDDGDSTFSWNCSPPPWLRLPSVVHPFVTFTPVWRRVGAKVSISKVALERQKQQLKWVTDIKGPILNQFHHKLLEHDLALCLQLPTETVGFSLKGPETSSPMPGMMWNWSLTSLSTAVVMMRTLGKA